MDIDRWATCQCSCSASSVLAERPRQIVATRWPRFALSAYRGDQATDDLLKISGEQASGVVGTNSDRRTRRVPRMFGIRCAKSASAVSLKTERVLRVMGNAESAQPFR